MIMPFISVDKLENIVKFLIVLVSLMLPVAVNAQEAATQKYIEGAFAAMDSNKDGKVERPEFDNFMRARLARQGQAFNEGFAKLDKNGDGQIDKIEAKANAALSENFASVDTNADGKISKAEIQAAMIAAQAAEAGAR